MRNRTWVGCWGGAVMVVALVLASTGARAADWPHWRGLERDGVSGESTGWDDGVRLPERELWSAEFGAGASSPLIVGGTLYTMGWGNGRDTVSAADAVTGEIQWRQSYKCPKFGRHAIGDQGMYYGVSATPEFDLATKFLYTLSIDGDLNCWDTKEGGKNVWKLNLYERYEIPRRPLVTRRGRRDYGYSTAPLVYGDWVLVEAGVPDTGNVIAFDKRTGVQVWGSENKDPAGHTGGLALMRVEGVPCVAVLTARNLVVTRIDAAKAGKEVARVLWSTDFLNNIATPAVDGNRVIVTSRYNIQATAMLEIGLVAGAREVWRIREASGVCSPVIYDGHVYWANKGLFCFDLATGKRRWVGDNYGDAGSCIATADGRLLIWADGGDLSIAETAKRSPDKPTVLEERSRIFRGMAWPHIVFADGRIYVRDLIGAVKCFSLRPDEQAKPAEEVPVEVRRRP